MSIKIFDGTNWRTQKSLSLYNGSSWRDAVKGWFYNGTSWRQVYPGFPINTVLPVISGSTDQGSTLTVNNGTWNADAAFAPTGYTYQWTKDNIDIGSATSSTYQIPSNETAGAVIRCKVTATNNRGSTTVTSSNSITVTTSLPGAPSNLVLTDATLTPSAPSSVTVTTTGTTTGSASWPAATNATSYSGTTTSGSISVNSGARTASITGGSTGSSFTVGITSINTNGRISMTWTAGANATGYDIYVGGVLVATNHTSTSYTYTGTSVGNFSVNVRSRNASGVETTGITNSVNLTQKTSSATNGSGTFLPGSPSNLSLSDNTATPSSPSGLSLSSITTTTASASWSAASNATSYTGSTTVGSISVNSGARTASITGGTPGSSFTVSITSVNTNGIIGISWSGGTGATSYDVYVSGSLIANTASTSLNYTIGTTGTFSVEVRSRNAGGQNTSGVSGNRSLTQKTSAASSVSGTFLSDAPAQVTGVNAVYAPDFCQFTDITWTAVSGASTYQIFHSSINTTPGTPQFTGIVGTFFRHENSNSRRWYWVRAVNSGGTVGPWSTGIFASQGACFL